MQDCFIWYDLQKTYKEMFSKYYSTLNKTEIKNKKQTTNWKGLQATLNVYVYIS